MNSVLNSEFGRLELRKNYYEVRSYKEGNYGKWFHSCINLSKSRNKTGYFRVSKTKNDALKQGYFYEYNYNKDGKRIRITSKDLDKLKEKVIEKELEWKKLSEL